MPTSGLIRYLTVLLVAALLASACTSDTDQGGQQESSEADFDAEEEFAADVQRGTVSGSASLGEFAPPDVDDTPLSIDGDTRIGTLDNGLTYYVRSNDSPGSSVTMRLAVRAGAIHEDPIGTGVAHFLEHMMFNGTERFPGNSLDAALRSIGAEIGADFNASTSDTETIYRISVEDRGDNVEIGLDVLSEWASAASLEPSAVTAEALVVREELRLRRDDGDGPVNEAFTQAYFAQTPFEGSELVGTPGSIDATTADQLREFYDTWYRPDNMAVIAVGDRSLDDLEDLIIERFADLEARGESISAPDLSIDQLRQDPLVDVVVAPEQGDSFVSVDIPIPTWDPTTVGGSELQLTEVILGIMINNRLVEAVDSGRLDLRRARGSRFQRNRGLSYLGFNFDADDLVTGTEAFLGELRASVQNPFTQRELDRAIDLIDNSIEQRVAQFETTQDSDFADAMASHFVGRGDLRSIDDVEDDTLDLLDSLEIDAVNDHYGWLLTSSAPIVIVVGPDQERTGTIEEITAAIERASESRADAFVDDLEEIEDLVDDPQPVEEIARRDLVANEGFELTFANGASVLFRESGISEGQVFVQSESPGGRAELSAADGGVAPTALRAISASGAGPWNQTQLRRFLADVDVSLTPYIADFSEGVSANAASDDLDVLFELLHLRLTQPRVDDIPLQQQREIARDGIDLAELDSSTAADIAVRDARTGGGSFAASPTRDALDALDADAVLNIWNDRFASIDDHVFVVVGDVDEDDVRDLARRWIGTLPDGGSVEEPEQPSRPGVVTATLNVGGATTNGAYRLLVVGKQTDTIRNQVLAELGSTILDDRIFTVVREELGATYGGGSNIDFSELGDEVELNVRIDGDPTRVDEIADTVVRELDAIGAGEISDDDFEEAVAIFGAELGFINNSFLMDSLFDEARNQPDEIVTRTAQREALDSIDRDDVASFLAELISQTDRVDIRNVPR